MVPQLMKKNCSNKEVRVIVQSSLFVPFANSVHLFVCDIGKFMHLQPNKIRQIINMDPESKMVSKEALVVIAKATEAFVRDLGGVCAQVSKTRKRKTLLLNDLLLAT